MIVLSNVKKLYDGTAGTAAAVHEGVDVWVDGGTIEAVKPHEAHPSHGRDVCRVDCSSLTMTPGLIDCHGHVTVLGVRDEDLAAMNGPAGMLYTERILYATLVHGGVTTVRDVGGATHVVKRLVEEGLLIGPRLIAICMLSTTGGHADFRGTDRCHEAVSRLWPPGPGRRLLTRVERCGSNNHTSPALDMRAMKGGGFFVTNRRILGRALTIAEAMSSPDILPEGRMKARAPLCMSASRSAGRLRIRSSLVRINQPYRPTAGSHSSSSALVAKCSLRSSTLHPC